MLTLALIMLSTSLFAAIGFCRRAAKVSKLTFVRSINAELWVYATVYGVSGVLAGISAAARRTEPAGALFALATLLCVIATSALCYMIAHQACGGAPVVGEQGDHHAFQ